MSDPSWWFDRRRGGGGGNPSTLPAEVFRARDTKLGREVALKVLSIGGEHSERHARFEREARLLASLSHPNVATLYGFEEHDGTHFLVMELVEGETLAERIARKPLALDEALPLFRQIAEGVEAAHERGIVHRDLKPPNIKITPTGGIKVLDFGLAKAFGPELGSEASENSPTITREGTATGVILGTAAYMSPEQARGKDLDKRSDVWAFGCCLYEALTGTPAFLGETLSDTIAAILDREPDWDKLPQSTPPSLVTMLRRTLTKDLRSRLHDIADARLEIESTLEAPAISERVDARRFTGLTLASLILAVVAAAVAVWSLTRTAPSSGGVTRSIIPLATETRLDLRDAGGPSVAISPNGRTIAYTASRGEATGIYLQPLDSMEPSEVENSSSARVPFFSPDSTSLGFRVAGRVMSVSINGGAPIAVSDTLFRTRGASWGELGIFFTPESTRGISRVSGDGGTAEVFTEPDRARLEKSHRFPEALPGGNAVLFSLLTLDMVSYDDAWIAVATRGTSGYRVLVEGGMSPRYSPTGHILYGRAGSLFAIPFDSDALEVTGPPTRVVEGVTMNRRNGSAEFAISREGTLIYAPGGPWGEDSRLVWIDRRGEVLRRSESRRSYLAPQISPDGQRVAVGIGAANDALWLYDVSRGTLTRMTSRFESLLPVWSPDGSRLIYTSTATGVFNVFSLAVDGTGEPKQLAPSDFVQLTGSISPDGRLVAFHESSGATGQRLVTVSVEDGTTQTLLETQFHEAEPMFSPDGRWFAYTSNESGRNEVYIGKFPPTGSKWQVSTAGGTTPRWNPNGRELFYRQGDDIMAVDVSTTGDLRLGESTVLFAWPYSQTYRGDHFGVSPDGEHFVLVDSTDSEPPPAHLVLIQNWFEELQRLAPAN